MLTQLKPCRWRSMLPQEGKISCSSQKLTGPKIGISSETCERCPYTDHAPIAVGIPWEPCEYRSSKRVHIPIAPDNVRDWRKCEHPKQPIGEIVCQCRGCSPQCAGYLAGDKPQERINPDQYVAPIPAQAKWKGRSECLANNAEITVVIPHLNTVEYLKLAVDMWRFQRPRVYIMIVDTGSPSGVLNAIEELRGDDCEIHHIRAGSYVHSSAPVGAAMELAQAMCPTRWMLSTHSDVFPRRRNFAAWLISKAEQGHPVVGWQMSPRVGIGDIWQRCVSHTATIWDMPVMRRIGLRWDFRWWLENAPDPRIVPGWPDTESPPALSLDRAGIVPLLLGTEPNHELHETEWFWHARSQASVKLYAGGSAVERNAKSYGDRALAMGRELVQQWTEEDSK